MAPLSFIPNIFSSDDVVWCGYNCLFGILLSIVFTIVEVIFMYILVLLKSFSSEVGSESNLLITIELFKSQRR